MRIDRIRALLPAVASLLLLVELSGCGHSRVVRRDYQPARESVSRPAYSRGATEPLPRGGVHVVRRGETLYGISFRYGLRYQDVASWNGISDPYVIEVGQRLRLQPGASDGRDAAAAPVATRPPATTSGPQQVPSRPPVGSAPPAGRPAVAVTGGPPWRWPAKGQIVGRYVSGDQTQQGINIAGNAGQPVAAAADGVVVYSGAGLVGYGELIIIKHSDEWLSAYAHNRRRMVTEGTRVHAGDTIAEMGRTGANRDMLHFEIRRNGKPVDPLLYLPAP